MAETLYDAVIVGSGASGGWAAKLLSEAGWRVAIVDAGRRQSDANFTEHEPAFRLKYREMAPEVLRRERPIQMMAANEFNYSWFASDLEEPYTTPPDMPFDWVGRLRVTGGRTNVWGRQSYRYSDLDFQAASFDGYGEDWPIRYADVAPYYDRVEEYIGVSGLAEGLPQLPDGHFQPAMAFRCCEAIFRERVKKKLGWTVTMGRSANLTRPLHGRAPCHYCGPCYQGCVTHSYFNSAFTTVADALATGRCDLIPNAMVYRVEMNAAGDRARGVVYVDRQTRRLHRVRGARVILAAQAQESVRILLNSADARHPLGLGNASGALGHYLMDNVWVGGGATGEFPEAMERPAASAPSRPNGIYVVNFRNLDAKTRSRDFIRGFGYQTWADAPTPNLRAPGFGDAFKRAILDPQPGRISLKGFGACLPRYDNFVEIDPGGLRDAFGIPVLRIHMRFGDNERAMIADMATAATEMMEAAGARNIQPYAIFDRHPGLGIHEAGIARMGRDASRSVLNEYQQCHEVKNLFVLDASGFVSLGCQNPTLTIMALAMRSSEAMLARAGRGEV